LYSPNIFTHTHERTHREGEGRERERERECPILINAFKFFEIMRNIEILFLRRCTVSRRNIFITKIWSWVKESRSNESQLF